MKTEYENKMMAIKSTNIKIKLNTPLRGLPEGTIVSVKTNKGIPVDSYWRRRIKDSKHDGCVSIVKKLSPSKAETKDTKEPKKSGKKE